jgi:hypothetical protein
MDTKRDNGLVFIGVWEMLTVAYWIPGLERLMVVKS